jgi:uncharacterized protein YndB with AHSA1/START domain
MQWMPRAMMLLLLAVPGVAAAGDEPRLDRGEIVVESRPVRGSDYQEVVARGVIDAPPTRVWKLLTHCARFRRTLPRILASKELSRKTDGDVVRVVCQITADMPWPYSDLTEVTEARLTVKDGVWRRSWRLLRGDYKENQGSWELRRFRGGERRTLLTYRAIVVPTSWVPGWIRRAAQRRTLPQMYRRFRDLVR